MAKKTMDYTKFKSDGEMTKKEPEASKEVVEKRWWSLKDKKEKAQSIVSVAASLKENQSYRLIQMNTSSRLYGNLPANSGTGNKQSTTTPAQKQRITYNVCQSAVDTATSKIGKNKPKPYFLTRGGNYRLKRKAQKLGKFVDGVFYYNQVPMTSRQVFKDAGISGTGLVHVFPKHGQVCIERALASELFIDDSEVVYGGTPRQLHWVRTVDRLSLAAMFSDEPDKVKMIMAAKEQKLPDQRQNQANASDQIVCIESWHLPSGPDAKDGCHTMVIDADEPLLDEEYKRPKFPFPKFNWNTRQHGYWGQGAIEQIQNIQMEINTILILIQRSMHLMGTFKIAIENTSKVVKQHVNNDIGTLLPYTKTPPQYLVPPIIQPEIYQHLQTLKNSAFEQLGISQLSAAAKKPDGLDSGKALREYNDIETDRFMTVGQDWEQFHLDIAEQVIWVAKDLYDSGESVQVKVPGKKFIETIKWKDVAMDEDQYILQAFPVSSLPDEPSAKMQTVQEYAQAGWITPRAAKRLMDFPDLEAADQLSSAQEDWVNEILEKIVMEGDYTTPVPELDLDLAEEMVLQYIAEGATSDLEDDKMDLLRRFNQQIKMLKQKAIQAAQPPPQAPANPAPAPTSPLIPNVNGPTAA